MFGGNSNWRGPDLDAGERAAHPRAAAVLPLLRRHFKVECPTGSGRQMNLFEVAHEIADRLTRIFLRDEHGRRPVFGGAREVPDRPALARPPPLLRVLPRRQRRRPRRQPPDRLDRPRRHAHPALRPPRWPAVPGGGPGGGVRGDPGAARKSEQREGLSEKESARPCRPLSHVSKPPALDVRSSGTE